MLVVERRWERFTADGKITASPLKENGDIKNSMTDLTY